MMIAKDRLSRFRIAGLYFGVALMVFSLAGIFSKGLNMGIDFTGGFITEFTTSEAMTQQDMKLALHQVIEGKFSLSSAKLSATDETSHHWIVRQPDSGTGETVQHWTAALNDYLLTQSPSTKKLSQEMHLGQIIPPQLEVLDSDFIGSPIGAELVDQGGLAMLVALLMIMLYLTTRFEWRFGLGAILALFHDVVFVVGLFAWTQIEFNLTVLASLLAIIGYSLNDSIIVADRIRELMQQTRNQSMAEIINSAIKITFNRTLITSGTTLVTIASIWWLGGKPLEGFSVALFGGILVGTFSSICISGTFPQLVGVKASFYLDKAKKRQEELSRSP